MGKALLKFASYCGEFNNANTHIVGNLEEARQIQIYDVHTGKPTLTLNLGETSDPENHAIATYSPDDNLILSSAVLWDIRSSTIVHKFDRFNEFGAERFHRSGNEVIINSEIWDLRTYKLIKTCSALDLMNTTFNTTGDVILGSIIGSMDLTTNVGKFFKVIDATTYTTITEVNTEKQVTDLDVAPNDDYVVVIENVVSILGRESSYVRLWEVGRDREDESEEESIEELDSEDDSLLSPPSHSSPLVDVDMGLFSEDSTGSWSNGFVDALM